MEYVRIPQDRVGVVIGKGGSTKKEIEERLAVSLNLDSEGMVAIENKGGDVLAEWKARDIVRAVGKGFSPEKALKLVEDDYVLEIIDLADLVGRSPKALERQKGRIIGTEGKTRRQIEESTGVYVSIYGKSVALLGTPEEIGVAREAVVMLAQGAAHSGVYRFLQKKGRELREKRTQLWKT